MDQHSTSSTIEPRVGWDKADVVVVNQFDGPATIVLEHEHGNKRNSISEYEPATGAKATTSPPMAIDFKSGGKDRWHAIVKVEGGEHKGMTYVASLKSNTVDLSAKNADKLLRFEVDDTRLKITDRNGSTLGTIEMRPAR